MNQRNFAGSHLVIRNVTAALGFLKDRFTVERNPESVLRNESSIKQFYSDLDQLLRFRSIRFIIKKPEIDRNRIHMMKIIFSEFVRVQNKYSFFSTFS